MKNNYPFIIVLFLGLFLLSPYSVFSQCNPDETLVTLQWTGGLNTDFEVYGVVNGLVYSANLATDNGTIDACFVTDLQKDCFMINIDGPSTLAWDLYTPLSASPVLSGNNMDMEFGQLCAPNGCASNETLLVLYWMDGLNTSFDISGDLSGPLFSATLMEDQGYMSQCFETNLQQECITIDINGSSNVMWYLYSSLYPGNHVLEGVSMDMQYGDCNSNVSENYSSNFDLFPNPVRGFLNIENLSKDFYNSKMTIMNILGDVVLTQSLKNQSNIQLDFTEYKPGLYQLNLSNSLHSVSKMIVVK